MTDLSQTVASIFCFSGIMAIIAIAAGSAIISRVYNRTGRIK